MPLQLTGTDSSGSPHLSLSGGVTQTFAYSPFGATTARTVAGASLPGFNGERADPLNGLTHLGNGYRAYSPALRRFTCPDSESPFGAGGINPYVYCGSDPINQADPSGHGPIMWLIEGTCWIARRAGRELRVAKSVASAVATTEKVITGVSAVANFATGIATAATRNSNPQASDKLHWAAVGLGITTAAFVAPEQISRAAERLRAVPSRAVSQSETPTRAGGFFSRFATSSSASPPPNARALGKNFYIFHGNADGSPGKRLIITAHGQSAFGSKVRVPVGSEIMYYGKEGAKLKDPRLYRIAQGNLKPFEVIPAGESTENYILDKYNPDIYDHIKNIVEANPGVDVLTVRNRGIGNMFSTTSDVLEALEKAGLHYEQIDAVHCRASVISTLFDTAETVEASRNYGPRQDWKALLYRGSSLIGNQGAHHGLTTHRHR